MPEDNPPPTQAVRTADLPFNKDILLLIPVLGSGLAIVFDVGYFSGIDINFFTLFSLNEHIVFSLEALPPSLIAVLLSGCWYYWRQGKPLSSPKMHFAMIWIKWALILVNAVLFAFVFKAYVLVLGFLLAAVVARLANNATVVPLRLMSVCLSATIIIFVTGYFFADNYISEWRFWPLPDQYVTTVISTKNDGDIEARVIRSGDRGILYLDLKSKQLSLLRWDEIKRLHHTQWR